MAIRAIVALFLGLLIQLSQVQTCVASESSRSTHTMDCCDGMKSCPCASKSDHDQKSTPIAPASVELKSVLSKPMPIPWIEGLIFPPDVPVVDATSVSSVRAGFAGVPLSVAFCSMVI